MSGGKLDTGKPSRFPEPKGTFKAETTTPLGDKVEASWAITRENGEALGAIQAAIDETKGNIAGYAPALRRIKRIADELISSLAN